MNILILLTGLFLFFISVKILKNKIKESGVRTILPLPVWSAICLGAGLFLGHKSIHLTIQGFLIIIGMLILTMPLQAWIDVKYIYKDEVWRVKDFIIGCSYEIGLVVIGVSLTRLYFSLIIYF